MQTLLSGFCSSLEDVVDMMEELQCTLPLPDLMEVNRFKYVNVNRLLEEENYELSLRFRNEALFSQVVMETCWMLHTFSMFCH